MFSEGVLIGYSEKLTAKFLIYNDHLSIPSGVFLVFLLMYVSAEYPSGTKQFSLQKLSVSTASGCHACGSTKGSL